MRPPEAALRKSFLSKVSSGAGMKGVVDLL